MRASGAGVVVGNSDPAPAVAEQLRAWEADPEVLESRRAAARRWRQQVLTSAPYEVFAERLAALARAQVYR